MKISKIFAFVYGHSRFGNLFSMIFVTNFSNKHRNCILIKSEYSYGYIHILLAWRASTTFMQAWLVPLILSQNFWDGIALLPNYSFKCPPSLFLVVIYGLWVRYKLHIQGCRYKGRSRVNNTSSHKGVSRLVLQEDKEDKLNKMPS